MQFSQGLEIIHPQASVTVIQIKSPLRNFQITETHTSRLNEKHTSTTVAQKIESFKTIFSNLCMTDLEWGVSLKVLNVTE